MLLPETFRPLHEAARQTVTREIFRLDAGRQIVAFEISPLHSTFPYIECVRQNLAIGRGRALDAIERGTA